MVDQKYLQIIRKSFPKILEEQIKVFDDGWDYLVFVVNGQNAFRFPRTKGERYIQRLSTEVNFLKQFYSKSPVLVPKLELHIDELEGSYVTYNFIPGVQFSKDLAKTFSKENLLVIAQRLGNFLTVLHSFSIEEAKDLGIVQLDPVTEWENNLEEIKKEVFSQISLKEQRWIVKLYEDFLKLIQASPFEARVIHFDIMPEHIIIDPDTQKISGIIDFTDIEIADPALDFCILHWYGDEFLQAIYKHYKLSRDNSFELRRKFYYDRLVVIYLKHSLKIQHQERIKGHKQQLSEYIENNPLP